MRAPRNRTIELTEDEVDGLRSQIGHGAANVSSLIHGDSLHTLPRLQTASFDLLFADPPYNLTKRFGKERFSQTSDDVYEAWLDSWLSMCVPLLKDTASIYICGDWRSSDRIPNRVSHRN